MLRRYIGPGRDGRPLVSERERYLCLIVQAYDKLRRTDAVQNLDFFDVLLRRLGDAAPTQLRYQVLEPKPTKNDWSKNLIIGRGVGQALPAVAT